MGGFFEAFCQEIQPLRCQDLYKSVYLCWGFSHKPMNKPRFLDVSWGKSSEWCFSASEARSSLFRSFCPASEGKNRSVCRRVGFSVWFQSSGRRRVLLKTFQAYGVDKYLASTLQRIQTSNTAQVTNKKRFAATIAAYERWFKSSESNVLLCFTWPRGAKPKVLFGRRKATVAFFKSWVFNRVFPEKFAT